ncbi:MAG: polysaccharide biosynthesis/export family protein [Muribaculaceae bacterium]|nr:polysaccharide biosynthesis/export family protein [Muribaculaceae bacterium]
MKKEIIYILSSFALLLGSCGTAKDVTYMQEADQLPAEVLNATAKVVDPVIMPGDILQINVGSLNTEAVKPFNKKEYLSSSPNITNTESENSIYYYLVDNNGYIDFPMLGQLHIGGMTQSAVQNHIASLIYPRYLTEKPNVEVRFRNFHVYVLGEVRSPGMLKAANGRMNVLEAIAQAGDLNIQGRRDNVMVIHTNADGSRSVNRVNLLDKNLLVSPHFNLQQNDIIYVAPNASRARSSWSVPPGLSLGMSAVGTLISIATFVITLTKL